MVLHMSLDHHRTTEQKDKYNSSLKLEFLEESGNTKQLKGGKT